MIMMICLTMQKLRYFSQFNEAHMNRLRNELAIADTHEIAYDV